MIGSSVKKLKNAEALGADILIDRSQNEDWAKALFIANKNAAWM
ncbi:hypothetical protein [Candidatus Villigracilis proximus]